MKSNGYTITRWLDSGEPEIRWQAYPTAAPNTDCVLFSSLFAAIRWTRSQ